MFDRLTENQLDEFLSSFNLLNNTSINKTKKILYWLSNNIYINYKDFKIKKKNGKLRQISEPTVILKRVQRNILNNVLIERKISKYATAYKKGVSLLDNAKPHVDKKIILKLDIKDFFDNITFIKVYNSCFNKDLYPKKIGMLLTNLCMYNERLPQGAPTSSYISNVVMRSFDEIVGKYCDSKNISYTRYSDDLTFSGDFNVNEIIKYIKEKLKENGFRINYKKIVVASKKTCQKVTGIIVNKKINISKEYKDKIRQEMYYIEKYSIDEHFKKINKNITKEKYILNLIGRINYVLQVDKNNVKFNEYKNILQKIL